MTIRKVVVLLLFMAVATFGACGSTQTVDTGLYSIVCDKSATIYEVDNGIEIEDTGIIIRTTKVDTDKPLTINSIYENMKETTDGVVTVEELNGIECVLTKIHDNDTKQVMKCYYFPVKKGIIQIEQLYEAKDKEMLAKAERILATFKITNPNLYKEGKSPVYNYDVEEKRSSGKSKEDRINRSGNPTNSRFVRYVGDFFTIDHPRDNPPELDEKGNVVFSNPSITITYELSPAMIEGNVTGLKNLQDLTHGNFMNYSSSIDEIQGRQVLRYKLEAGTMYNETFEFPLDGVIVKVDLISMMNIETQEFDDLDLAYKIIETFEITDPDFFKGMDSTRLDPGENNILTLQSTCY